MTNIDFSGVAGKCHSKYRFHGADEINKGYLKISCPSEPEEEAIDTSETEISQLEKGMQVSIEPVSSSPEPKYSSRGSADITTTSNQPELYPMNEVNGTDQAASSPREFQAAPTQSNTEEGGPPSVSISHDHEFVTKTFDEAPHTDRLTTVPSQISQDSRATSTTSRIDSLNIFKETGQKEAADQKEVPAPRPNPTSYTEADGQLANVQSQPTTNVFTNQTANAIPRQTTSIQTEFLQGPIQGTPSVSFNTNVPNQRSASSTTGRPLTTELPRQGVTEIWVLQII